MVEKGEIITLEDNKEYVCYYALENNGLNYVYLLSNFKPLEIRFGIQRMVDDKIEIEIIYDDDQKQQVLQMFTEKFQ